MLVILRRELVGIKSTVSRFRTDSFVIVSASTAEISDTEITWLTIGFVTVRAVPVT